MTLSVQEAVDDKSAVFFCFLNLFMQVFMNLHEEGNYPFI